MGLVRCSPDFGAVTVTVTIMGGGGGDNDGGNSDSSIFVELATQYRSDTAPLRVDGREGERVDRWKSLPELN